MPKRKNTFQYKIGEKWAEEYFAGRKNKGYLINKRAHHKHPEENITFNKGNVGSLLKQLKKLKTSDNYLVIVRTYKDKSSYSTAYSYFIHVSQKLIEKYAANQKSLTFYPRINRDFGIEYWEKTGLVKYYPIDQSYFSTEINLSEEIDDEETFIEGAKKQITVNAYERNPDARQKCLDKYGYSCSVCKFNFYETYGDIGKEFIHVHHTKELNLIGEEYEVDPIQDLCPVCANCHAMLHKRKPAYSIEELKLFLRLDRPNC